MVEIIKNYDDSIFGFKFSGKLHDEDYKQFVPAVEDALKKNNKIKVLAQFENFEGWDMKAMWDDFKFGIEDATKIERLAMVGDKKWEELLANIFKPFMKGEVKYFDQKEIDAAWNWLQSSTKGEK